MASDEVCANYLRDLGALIREMAARAASDYAAGRGGDDETLLLGRLAAFHEVVSLMQQQALAFDIPLDKLSLGGLDPDRDLL